ncbi:hypothetical protein BDV25DRAFT_168639 [Aspergillus avenaceus]|uniref:Uncharacterized protein n=1 Tax=Aspergillus avenaceus TaxID=36643 RepID=A0A5N6TPU8_ASPAV|nr:hypothetical protein BDV25DRAFT_168639 [Aspergillus avenaceus]
MMASPIDLDITPNPRTREENQERAFIAASRRKDRSLDARLESANRASQLHKQRTGKALHITRDIVEKEAMYEEIDDRYQEKIQRMLEAQNMQINSHLQQNLYATLASRPGLQHRRASVMAQRRPMDGVRKMSLDLSSIRNSISEGMHGSIQTTPLTSPLAMGGHSYVMSPVTNGSSCQSPSFHQPHGLPTPSGQMPSYIAQNPHSTPTWSPQVGALRSPWTGLHYASQMPVSGGMDMPVRQFRDRMGSAPVIPVHAIPSSAAYRPTLSSQHTRNRSEPGQIPTQHMLSHSTSPQLDHTPKVEQVSPPVESLSTETLPTPDLCPTPSTPRSPTAIKTEDVVSFDALDKESEYVPFSQPFLDQDFVDFQGLSYSLSTNPAIPGALHQAMPSHPEPDWKSDEIVQMDEWLVGA